MTRQEWARELHVLGTRAQRERMEGRIEDYQFIGGDRMSAARAAERLGVTERTITRYRRALREQAEVTR